MTRWLVRPLAALVAAAFLAVVAPVLLVLLALLLLGADCAALLVRRKRPDVAKGVSKDAVSVVIPTWNGKEHLASNLPSVVEALSGNPDHEILVIENASDDGSAEFLAREFPSVRVVEMGSNLGFGRASNVGFSIARHEVVVLLNNDMRVEPDFLRPLLEGFRDPRVFSVTGQIYFQDSGKPREETGLTMGRWHRGGIRLQHVADEAVDELFPTFYAGGGSSAYDRLKILELGGFDEILAPFYMEDVDVSYMAWKRGWVNLYAPGSVVHHEHRGTIGKHFDQAYIDRVLQKNRLLFAWKNMHHWRRLLGHFGWVYGEMWLSLAAGASAERASVRSFLVALAQSARAAARRAAARRLAEVTDAEALRRPLGGYFRDRFHRLESKPQSDLNVLFVSPYPIEPPTHGGAVLMKQAVEGLARRCRLHLLCMMERNSELEGHERLADQCASAEFFLYDPRRRYGAPLLWPQSAQAFWSPEFLWKIHRTILLRRIDVIQLEYSQLASYGGSFRQLVCCLFEHDLHFQSVQRNLLAKGPLQIARRGYEYLRALRFELSAIAVFDSVQVCSAEQARVLRDLLGDGPSVHHNVRTGISVGSYSFRLEGREPGTVLFVGNFRHPPNLEALQFFRERVLPRVRERMPQARLVVAGAEAPAHLTAVLESEGAKYLGSVPEIRDVLGRYEVFVAPVLSGSGVRVKILEAFASGIPVVSTSLGAEGLCDTDSGMAEIQDRPAAFADAVVALLNSRSRARAIAGQARRAVERNWNSETTIPRLLDHYAAASETKLLLRSAYPLPLR